MNLKNEAKKIYTQVKFSMKSCTGPQLINLSKRKLKMYNLHHTCTHCYHNGCLVLLPRLKNRTNLDLGLRGVEAKLLPELPGDLATAVTPH